VHIDYSLVVRVLKISGSIVLYNNALDDVDHLVNNFLNVTSDIEDVCVYLVNNSNDNIELTKHINMLQEQDTRVKALIPNSNKGFGAGHNMVIPYLNSDYHFIVNPDISISNKYEINKMLDFLEQHLDYGMLAPLVKYPSGEVQHLLKKESNLLDMFLRFLKVPILKKRQNKFINLPDGYDYIHDAVNVPGSFLVIRTQIFKQINGFDEKYFLYMEDSDLTMKVNEVSNTVFFPKAFVYHEWQRDNQKSLKGIFQMLKSMRIYFHKWGWKLW
jgi:GT2 family glycosyltransferase